MLGMDFIYINFLLCFLLNSKLMPTQGLIDQIPEVAVTAIN